MLTEHKLLIDKDCPMCQLYAKAFVKINLVDTETVNFYQTTPEETFQLIDAKRAKSEVALVNPDRTKIHYGIDAFLTILSHKNRFLKWLFAIPVVYFLLSKLYRFISYNRHVMTGPGNIEYSRPCVPEKHLGYRWLYIVLIALLTGFVVNHFAYLLNHNLGIEHNHWREFLICFGQIGWQFMFLSLIKAKKRLDYLGNMSTVSFIGALLLLPLFLVNYWIKLSLISLALGFGLVVGIMFILHVRRSKKLGLPLSVSISWVTYRTVVLGIILITTLL